jgi:hypothetical protein
MKIYGVIDVVLTSEVFGRERSASRPGRFSYGEAASVILSMGGWVGPRGDLDDMGE